jgi:hypothetical protein
MEHQSARIAGDARSICMRCARYTYMYIYITLFNLLRECRAWHRPIHNTLECAWHFLGIRAGFVQDPRNKMRASHTFFASNVASHASASRQISMWNGSVYRIRYTNAIPRRMRKSFCYFTPVNGHIPHCDLPSMCAYNKYVHFSFNRRNKKFRPGIHEDCFDPEARWLASWPISFRLAQKGKVFHSISQEVTQFYERAIILIMNIEFGSPESTSEEKHIKWWKIKRWHVVSKQFFSLIMVVLTLALPLRLVQYLLRCASYSRVHVGVGLAYI